MREDNFRNVCETEGLSIRGPDEEKEAGWVTEPDRQLALLSGFWGKVTAGSSLVFYYCKDGHPFDREFSRIVVGIGRIKAIGPQIFFGKSAKHPGDFPVWSRRVTQDYPSQGVRLPYQEYLRRGFSPSSILCPVPASVQANFSYVAEHVSDDAAISVVERFIQSVEQVRNEGKVAGDWNASLIWLNTALADLWTGRGPFPGLGSMLEFLGCATGTTFQRSVLTPMAKRGENPLDHVLALLAGKIEIPKNGHETGLKTAKAKWGKIKSRHELLATLTRFELTSDQFRRAADPDERASARIAATEKDIVANPYLLCEMDCGTETSDPISLDAIDHGMIPVGDAKLFAAGEQIEGDDQRRIRGTAVDLLKEAADMGDTLLELRDLFERIKGRFPVSRICRPDAEIFRSDLQFHRERLWSDFDHQPPIVATNELQRLEAESAQILRERAAAPVRKPGVSPDWNATLEKKFGKPKSERERIALNEKKSSLTTLFSQKLSFLVGGAGTGKTTVLEVFLDELEKAEGKKPVLLLAPTGKARVRLSTKTDREAKTIHSFLLKSGWISGATFRLNDTGGQKSNAVTVVIDECSMIATDLFGTLLRALDANAVRRLILVGDPNQLPPIGPGRPFVDALRWAEQNAGATIARLRTCMRTSEGEKQASAGLALADTYRSDVFHPADDELLSTVAKAGSQGDLECHFWTGHEDLKRVLKARMGDLLKIAPGDYTTFNKSLGATPDDQHFELCESWQILCATRGELSGTEELNRLIQSEFRGGILTRARHGRPRPFGDQEIVWCDKVLQVRNRKKKAWPHNADNFDYVANGEIGIVASSYNDGINVGFSTQPTVTYSYSRPQVGEFLELGYALTTHKAQGSDFDIVFVILPENAPTLSRELIYTALTRFRKRLVLLLEKDLGALLRFRAPESSDTEQRNTQMFGVQLRPSSEQVFRPEGLIHRTHKGIAVRSKSEVIVAETLERLGLSFSYEEPLRNPDDSRDFRLPDFTVRWQGETFYWEHLGMRGVPNYENAWKRKLAWYEKNGFLGQLVTSEDKPDGGIDGTVIEEIARRKIIES